MSKVIDIFHLPVSDASSSSCEGGNSSGKAVSRIRVPAPVRDKQGLGKIDAVLTPSSR